MPTHAETAWPGRPAAAVDFPASGSYRLALRQRVENRSNSIPVTASRTYDVVLFGASGFTGGLTAHYLLSAAAKRPLRWALAGRNREKLAAVRAQLAQIDARAAQIEILAADASDATALRAMAQSTRVVATTVGPYIKHGEPLVRACAEAGTHYVDLTGEPEFVDRMIERYHATAARNRAKIVNSCGFDSVPHDLGAYFAVQQLAAAAS